MSLFLKYQKFCVGTLKAVCKDQVEMEPLLQQSESISENCFNGSFEKETLFIHFVLKEEKEKRKKLFELFLVSPNFFFSFPKNRNH